MFLIDFIIVNRIRFMGATRRSSSFIILQPWPRKFDSVFCLPPRWFLFRNARAFFLIAMHTFTSFYLSLTICIVLKFNYLIVWEPRTDNLWETRWFSKPPIGRTIICMSVVHSAHDFDASRIPNDHVQIKSWL